MKTAYWTLVLLIIIGLIGMTGCIEYPSQKTTGGGWFFDSTTGNKITFGFNAQPIEDGDAQGKFQLIDHVDKTRVHGTFFITHDVTAPDSSALFEGTCSINGSGDYDLYVIFLDLGEPGIAAGDNITVGVNTTAPLIYSGSIGGGNIQIHKDKD